MKYNKRIKNFILGAVLLGQSRRSFQLSLNKYQKVVNNNANAMECFSNPSQDMCAAVENFMINLKPEVDDVLTAEYAFNIIEAIRNGSWNIDSLDLQNGEITSVIYTTKPPPSIKEIKLSNNLPLKQTIASIPDDFIRYLTVCPFKSTDGIKISGCSVRLKNLCASNIKCVDGKISNSGSKINDDEYYYNNTVITSGKIEAGSHEPDIDDKGNKKNDTDTKTLIETFMFGLLTSVCILVFLLVLLCLIQTYSRKNIMNFKKISEYYENKPLVNNSGKTNSSSMNETTSQSVHSNYAYSNISQASYSNPKHKRYLYVFDDGSVMMSKNRNQNNQNNPMLQSSNSSMVSSQNYFNNSLNGKYFILFYI